MVMPLSEFSPEKRAAIERAAAAPDPPPRWIFFGDPADGRPLASIMSRAYYEWWLRRGVDLLTQPERESISSGLRQVIIARDGFICRLCSKPVEPDDIHIDHIIPVSRGGRSYPGNLQVTHSLCNVLKSNRVD